MSTVEHLQRELVIHRDIYEIARDKLIETEINLKNAIAEENELNKAADRARRIFFAAFAGITVAVATINIWA